MAIRPVALSIILLSSPVFSPAQHLGIVVEEARIGTPVTKPEPRFRIRGDPRQIYPWHWESNQGEHLCCGPLDAVAQEPKAEEGPRLGYPGGSGIESLRQIRFANRFAIST